MTLDKILFLKKQLENMFNVRIHLDLYVYISYINCQVFEENCIEIQLIDSKFYTVYPVVMSLK